MDSLENGILEPGKVAPKNDRNGVPKVALMMEVHPPRRDDLQPSYEQTVQSDDTNAEAHGWYSSMSECPRSNPLTNAHKD
jgi:hypothetical protein